MDLYFAFSSLVIAITSTTLGLFVFLKNRKSRVNQTFALFCLSVSIWSWFYIFWPLAKDRESTLFWFRMLHIGSIFISITYFHFIVTWLNLYQKKKKILFFGYFLALFFLSFVFSPLFIKDMVPKFSMRYWAEPGILYHFYLVMFFGFAIYASYLLFVNYRKAEGIKKEQIKYFLFGMILAYIGGSTNYFLWYNINIPPYGDILGVAYVVLTAYAIVEKKLFDIRIVLTSLFIGLIAFLFALDILIFTPDLLFKLYKSLILVIFFYFGYLLIRSVLREIKYREEIAEAYEVEKKAREKLKKLDDAKNQFIMATQHHLRTPLTSMIGYLDLIFGGTYGKVSPKIKETLQKFQASTNRLIKVVNEFLDISQFQLGKKVITLQPDIQIEPIFEEIIEDLQLEAKARGIYLKLQKPVLRQAQDKIPKIKADPEKLKMALYNVIDNGIKYTNKGGVTIRLKVENSRLRIIVKDTGAGISKEDQKVLFTRLFERGKEAERLHGTGKGIGLYIAFHIIKAHKGKIWAESEGRGKGSTFYVELPIG